MKPLVLRLGFGRGVNNPTSKRAIVVMVEDNKCDYYGLFLTALQEVIWPRIGMLKNEDYTLWDSGNQGKLEFRCAFLLKTKYS